MAPSPANERERLLRAWANAALAYDDEALYYERRAREFRAKAQLERDRIVSAGGKPPARLCDEDHT